MVINSFPACINNQHTNIIKSILFLLNDLEKHVNSKIELYVAIYIYNI